MVAHALSCTTINTMNMLLFFFIHKYYPFSLYSFYFIDPILNQVRHCCHNRGYNFLCDFPVDILPLQVKTYRVEYVRTEMEIEKSEYQYQMSL